LVQEAREETARQPPQMVETPHSAPSHQMVVEAVGLQQIEELMVALAAVVVHGQAVLVVLGTFQAHLHLKEIMVVLDLCPTLCRMEAVAAVVRVVMGKLLLVMEAMVALEPPLVFLDYR
jgi:hypothetical protein